jgi:hypothetical protein
MWEASAGIIVILAVIFFIGILSSADSAKPRARSRREIARVIGSTGAIATGLTGPTNLNTEPDSERPNAAQQQAAKGVSLDRPAKTTPAEMAVRG